MTDSNGDRAVVAILGLDRNCPAVTPDAVAGALKGFPLQLVDGKDICWLATAVRRSLAMTLKSNVEGSERTSNADIRADLERMAESIDSTWLELFNRDPAADSRLWQHAFNHWTGEGGTDIGDGLVMGEPLAHRRFQDAIQELEWLASFIREAAKATESQGRRWRQSEERKLRVERGQLLAPIFEVAFGEEVSANNYKNGDARHTTPTPFMTFYQRMVALAFNEQATPNLAKVLKAGCQLHKKDPVQFGDGIIPGM